MIAIYARQSIDKKDSISIEVQIEKCKALYQEEEFCIYIDKGFSGKNTKRPRFQQLMNDVREHKINRVVVYKLDRFSRSLLDFATAWHELEKNGVEFVSVEEKFDTSTPMGKAMLFITEIFAQLERETISGRVTDNYYARTGNGSWPGGPAPYGFDIDRMINPANGKKVPILVPNENMHVVKMIFDLYNSGYSLGAIAKLLYEKNIPGVKSKTWTNVSIRRLIRNPAYVKADIDVYAWYKKNKTNIVNDVDAFDGSRAGILVGKKCGVEKRVYTGADKQTFSLAYWPGIIESEVWVSCQKKLVQNRQIKNTGKGKYSWLSGLLKCGVCGYGIKIFISPDTGQKKCGCIGHRERRCDVIPQFSIEEIEHEVEKQLVQSLSSCVDEIVEEEQKLYVRKELKTIEEKMDNLIETLSMGANPLLVDRINQELERLEQRKEEIKTELIDEKSPRKIKYDRIDFPTLDMENKKKIAGTYIEKVLATDDEIEIVWKV